MKASKDNKPILPGATLGMLGSGQLGRMFTLAAKRMGYTVHVYSPEANSPAGQVADREWVAPYDELESLQEFARTVSVISLEFENIPVATLDAVADICPVRPGPQVLHITQHRLREKTTLHQAGFPVTPFLAIRSLDDLKQAAATLNLPAVLKTAGFGYDGKGQVKLTQSGDLESAWQQMQGQEAILEAFVDFEKEISVVAARSADGSFAHFGAIENRHANHILDVSLSPATTTPEIERQAVETTRAVMEHLNVIGTFCVEFFVTRDGKLLINELAPRPHNSGHLTIEGFMTCQFEQQVRAVCGLPLGSTHRTAPAAAMANLLGELWQTGAPDWVALSRDFPEVKLHLYGKSTARPGRKMGHLTVLAATPEEAAQHVVAARQTLIGHTAVLR